jgi:hypothetical protein
MYKNYWLVLYLFMAYYTCSHAALGSALMTVPEEGVMPEGEELSPFIDQPRLPGSDVNAVDKMVPSLRAAEKESMVTGASVMCVMAGQEVLLAKKYVSFREPVHHVGDGTKEVQEQQKVSEGEAVVQESRTALGMMQQAAAIVPKPSSSAADMFKCIECERIFRSAHDLYKHKELAGSCRVLQRILREQYEEELLEEWSPTVQRCEQCGRYFDTDVFEQHRKRKSYCPYNDPRVRPAEKPKKRRSQEQLLKEDVVASDTE